MIILIDPKHFHIYWHDLFYVHIILNLHLSHLNVI